jgi:hypothetical protein
VTATELADYERTFRRARLRKRYFLPPIVGSLIVIARASADADPDRQELGLVVGSFQLALFGVVMLIPDQVSRYTSRLREAGLGVSIAPVRGGAGLAMSGSF